MWPAYVSYLHDSTRFLEHVALADRALARDLACLKLGCRAHLQLDHENSHVHLV